MVSNARRQAALLALSVMATALLGLIGAHAHGFGEIDRVAHSLVAIDHLPAPSAHLDRAVELEHPVCGDCLLASLKGDSAQPPLPGVGLAPSGLAPSALDTAGPRLRFARRAPARAPPHS